MERNGIYAELQEILHHTLLEELGHLHYKIAISARREYGSALNIPAVSPATHTSPSRIAYTDEAPTQQPLPRTTVPSLPLDQMRTARSGESCPDTHPLPLRTNELGVSVIIVTKPLSRSFSEFVIGAMGTRDRKMKRLWGCFMEKL